MSKEGRDLGGGADYCTHPQVQTASTSEILHIIIQNEEENSSTYS